MITTWRTSILQSGLGLMLRLAHFALIQVMVRGALGRAMQASNSCSSHTRQEGKHSSTRSRKEIQAGTIWPITRQKENGHWFNMEARSAGWPADS